MSGEFSGDGGKGGLGDVEVEGRESLVEKFNSLHKLATERAVGRILLVDGLEDLVIKGFPELESDIRRNLRVRLSGLRGSQGGNRPELWQTYPELKGANRAKYNRFIKSALFGVPVVEETNDPASIVKTGIEGGFFLLPGMVFKTNIVVTGIDGVNLPKDGVSMGVAMGRAVRAFVYEDKRRGRSPFLKLVICGGVERVWSPEAEKVLGVEGRLGERVRQSVNIALRVAAENMANPYRGGLPGLGKRS